MYSFVQGHRPATARRTTQQDNARPAAPATAHAAVAAPLTRRELIAHWNQWAQAPGVEPNEQRALAVRRMTAQLNRSARSNLLHLNQHGRLELRLLRLTSLPEHLPPDTRELSLYGNRITRLPERLPEHLRMLLASFNQLTELPRRLPSSLQVLYLDHNQFRHLPDNLPTGLQNLELGANQLTHLPENLPASLTHLNAVDNRLIRLPAHLPRGMTELHLNNNRLTDFPENPLATLPQLRQLIAIGNPWSPATLRSLVNHLDQMEGHRPSVLVTTPMEQMWSYSDRRAQAFNQAPVGPVPEVEPHLQSIIQGPLQRAVEAWVAPRRTDASPQPNAWQAFANEPGAMAFTEFLNRLRDTVNYRSTQFRRGVSEWLAHLETQPQLRQETFVISEGATTSCEDRVSLSFNAMRQLRLASDVARGDYDRRLPELLTHARSMFRLDQLEQIARETAASLGPVDEIEVYLGYQVSLRSALSLPVDTSDMRFFNMSNLTRDHIDQALRRVLDAERRDFANFLSTDWQPWQTVLERLMPERYQQAQEELIEAMDGEFTTRLNNRLREMGLQGNADAERQMGPQVQNEIAREINGRITNEFLARQGLSHWVHPRTGFFR